MIQTVFVGAVRLGGDASAVVGGDEQVSDEAPQDRVLLPRHAVVRDISTWL